MSFRRRADEPDFGGHEPNLQADLLLAAEGVLRYVWEGKFGSMLIEVRDDHTYVNGQLVEQVGQA